MDPNTPDIRPPLPVVGLAAMALAYTTLVAVLVGFAAPLAMVFDRLELEPPGLCALAIAGGQWLGSVTGASVSVVALSVLLWWCAKVVAPARRSRWAWALAILLMIAGGTVLIGILIPTSKLAAAATSAPAAPR